jgi:hypothetical protein
MRSYMLLSVASSKTRMVNVRLTERVHEDFKIACELRGVSMSSLMHQFVIRTIREEREMEPRAFLRHESPNVSNGIPLASKTAHPIPLQKEEVQRKRRSK